MWLISGYKNIQFWQLHSAVACRWVDQSDNITPAIWRIVTHSHDVPENQKSWVDKGTNGLNFSWFECGGDTVVRLIGWLPWLPSSHESGGPDDGKTESEWQRAPCSLGFVLSLSVTHFNIFSSVILHDTIYRLVKHDLWFTPCLDDNGKIIDTQ